MIYYLIIIPLVLYAYIAPKFIRKTKYLHYLIAIIIAIVSGTGEGYNFVNEGFLGLSFFIIVMFTSVLSSSTLKKRLMSLRGIYSIIGFILISSHAIAYFAYTVDENIFFSHVVIPIGLLVYLTFIPLFITSFTVIRKHIPYKQWKAIHRYAYQGYLLLFFHLYLIDNSRQIFYVGLFGIYTVFRLIQAIDKYFTKNKALKIQQQRINDIESKKVTSN